MPIGLHIAWNFAQGYLFGPEASVFALIVVSVVPLAALSITKKTDRLTGQPHLPNRPTAAT